MASYFNMPAGPMDELKLDDGSYITGTLVWYSVICEREVWLMSRNITPDFDDESLQVGRAVHETTYIEAKKEIQMDGIRIDLIKEKEHVVCEIKTSSKYIESAKLQLLYYLYRLKLEGHEFQGKILIPKERNTVNVHLSEQEEYRLKETLSRIKSITRLETPPEPVFISYCRRCAYRYFCWSE